MPVLHFDWTINVGTVCSVFMLLGAVVNYGSRVVGYLKTMSLRVNVMWEQFEKDHPELLKHHHHVEMGL